MPESKDDLSKLELASLKDLELSVSLKKNGIPSTKDVLDIISYFEREKGLESYQDMIHYLDTTSLESIDSHLKEIGLTSPDATERVVKGIEGLAKLNIGFGQLSKKLHPVMPSSSYLSELSKAIAPLSELSKAIAPLSELSKAIRPIEVGSTFSMELNRSLKWSQQLQESSQIGKAFQESLKQIPKLQVGLAVSELQLNSLKGIQEKLKDLQPIATGWQQAIQQIKPIRFEPFLPSSELAVLKGLEAAPKLDRPVTQFVETLEETEDNLAKTTRIVSKIVKPPSPKIGAAQQKLLLVVYELSRQHTGLPNTSATFQIFEPSDIKKLEIAQFLADIGLMDLKDDDRSLSITPKGIDFAKKISGKTPRTRAISKPNKFERKIFLAFGRDKKMKNRVQGAIEDMGIGCEVLEDGYLPGYAIIEKFLESCKDKDLALVLVTPDDLYCEETDAKTEKLNKSDKPEEDSKEWIQRMRARQNVIWEIGFFYAKFGRERTIIVHKEHDKFEWPSNIGSTDYVPFNNKWKRKVACALMKCGYELNSEKVYKC